MPCNVFGPGDNYDLNTSHFLPAILKKIRLIEEKKMQHLYLWGNGKALREVIYVDDLADACLYFLNKKYNPTLINIGTDIEFSIKNFAEQIMKILKIQAKIKFHKTNIKGTYRKKLDTSLATKLGWKFKTKFSNAIIKTYELL